MSFITLYLFKLIPVLFHIFILFLLQGSLALYSFANFNYASETTQQKILTVKCIFVNPNPAPLSGPCARMSVNRERFSCYYISYLRYLPLMHLSDNNLNVIKIYLVIVIRRDTFRTN